MTEQELLSWFGELDQSLARVPRDEDGYYSDRAASQWLAEAQSALAAVFPQGHAIPRNWKACFEHVERQKYSIRSAIALEEAGGVFRAGYSLLQKGRGGSLLDGVRAETVGELLDQAQALLPKYVVAAAVLAGGALETHLLHLCERSGLKWKGDGSISKYDQAIAEARNSGTVEVYSATDSKLIAGWGGTRNDAAHKPTQFNKTEPEVRLMVDGIRQFVSRVP